MIAGFLSIGVFDDLDVSSYAGAENFLFYVAVFVFVLWLESAVAAITAHFGIEFLDRLLVKTVGSYVAHLLFFDFLVEV